MRNDSQGFSLVELLMVLALAFIIVSAALPSFNQVNKVSSAVSAEEMVSSKLRQAHETAITQRKAIMINFVDPNKVQISVMTSKTTSSLLEEFYLPTGISFNSGIGSATPENMSGLLNLRNSSYVYFGDGSARDNATAGNLINGVIYFGDTASATQDAAVAITVLGSTGRARSYHYNSNTSTWF